MGTAVCFGVLVALIISLTSILPATGETLGSWTTTNPWKNSDLTGVTGESCAASSGYIYCVGGFLVGGPLDAVYTAPISSSGVGTWTFANDYPTGFDGGSCVIYSGYIYCVGGSVDSDGDYTSAVYSATVSSGTVGTWQATTDYPIIIAGESCAASSGYIYCVGGSADDEYPNTATNAVEYATLSDGTVGTWTQADYPQIMNNPSCAISGSDIYCVGGRTIPEGDTTQVPVEIVDYASISDGLSGWTQTTAYPTSIAYTSCVTNNGYIYCVGGDLDNEGDFTSATYYAPVSSSGVGTWSQTSDYVQEVYLESCVTSSGYLYCVGGQTEGSYIIGTVAYSAIGGGSGTTSSSSSTSSSTSTSSTSVSTSSSSGPGSPSPTPPPLPPVLPLDVTLDQNQAGSSPMSGKLVGLYGDAILYNVPGLNYSSLVNPYVISFCSVSGQNLIRVSGFGSVGPGLNSSEILVSDWTSILTSSQGWPTEPACSG